MAVPDPDSTNAAIGAIAAIVTGVTVLLLAFLSHLGKKEPAEQAKALLTERPVSHTELLQCQINVTDMVREELKEFSKEFREEFMREVRTLHIRLNKEGK